MQVGWNKGEQSHPLQSTPTLSLLLTIPTTSYTLTSTGMVHIIAWKCVNLLCNFTTYVKFRTIKIHFSELTLYETRSNNVNILLILVELKGANGVFVGARGKVFDIYLAFLRFRDFHLPGNG